MSLTIHRDSLATNQRYQVQVRSLVFTHENSMYKGIPSEWTDPVDWTSNDGTLQISLLLVFYFFLEKESVLFRSDQNGPNKSSSMVIIIIIFHSVF